MADSAAGGRPAAGAHRERRGGAAAGPYGGGPGWSPAGVDGGRRPAPGGAAAGRAAVGDRVGGGPVAGALRRPVGRPVGRHAGHPRRREGRHGTTRRAGLGGQPAGHRRPGRRRLRADAAGPGTSGGAAVRHRAAPHHAGHGHLVVPDVGAPRGPVVALVGGVRRAGGSGHGGVAARRGPARPAVGAGGQVDGAGRAARLRQHLPDARPDPGVRGAAAGRDRRGAGRPGPARGLGPARAAPGAPRGGRPPGHPVALRGGPARP